ncbi:MAG: ABC transporter permease, partial [Anaerolineae bacterium]|nr:ABC transporter permease [Gemmatimonadaceae bacterium]
LKGSVTPEQAQAKLNVLAKSINHTLPPGSASYGVLVTPLLDEIYGPAKTGIWLLSGAVFLVLLIACGNAANLLLARATHRDRELALRAMLGADRKRLLGLLLAESVCLSVVSAALGLLLAQLGIQALTRLAPPDVPGMDLIALNTPVLLFSILLSFGTVLVFGVGPALIATRRVPAEAIRAGGRSASSDHQHTALRQWLIGAEVAVSVVLLVGAGLLIRSFREVATLDPGFDARQVLTFRLTTSTGSQEKRREIYARTLERIRALPGVTSAAAILLRPLSGLVGWDTVYTVERQSPEEQLRNPNGNYQAISPDYFRTMTVRLIAGRDFSASDTESAPGVVIVNEGTARRHWPQLDAIGKRVRLSKDSKAPWLTVVGIARDVRYREWEAVRPDFYIPYTQRAQHRTDFVVKTTGDPRTFAAAVRREVLAIDKNQPISNVTTMAALVDRAIARSRFVGVVLTALAASALLLAAIGIYGVLSYTVVQRTKEIGIRMAVGATSSKIIWLVMAGGLRVVALGTIAGGAAAALLTRFISSLLFGITAADPIAWLTAACALLLAATVACMLPALRATVVDPVRALQSE